MKRKDFTHKAIQKKLAALLPEAELEVPFESIRRIADVVFFSKKLIFEVQYSPISLYEAQKRNKDYSSQGFNVIWILHDRIYNKKLVSPTELYLRRGPCYYTSITQFGHGIFYDQLEFFHEGQKLYQSAPFIIKNFLPLPFSKTPLLFPKVIKNKLKKFPFCFEGDLAHSLLNTTENRWARSLEKHWTKRFSVKSWLSSHFHSLLKRYSTASDRL